MHKLRFQIFLSGQKISRVFPTPADDEATRPYRQNLLDPAPLLPNLVALIDGIHDELIYLGLIWRVLLGRACFFREVLPRFRHQYKTPAKENLPFGIITME